MKRFITLFDHSWRCLLLTSVLVFIQASCSFVLGAMCDGGVDSFPAWPALALGWLAGSAFVSLSASIMASKRCDYLLGKMTVAPCFLFLYSLLIACFLCFALFGSIHLAYPSSFLSRSGFVTIILPTLSLILDGAAFFIAFSVKGKQQ